MGGMSVLGFLTTPFSVHSKSKIAHWTSFFKLFTQNTGDLPGGIPEGDEYFFGYILFP